MGGLPARETQVSTPMDGELPGATIARTLGPIIDYATAASFEFPFCKEPSSNKFRAASVIPRLGSTNESENVGEALSGSARQAPVPMTKAAGTRVQHATATRAAPDRAEACRRDYRGGCP